MLDGLRNFLVRNYIPCQNAGIAKTQGDQPVSLSFWLNRRQKLRRYASKDDILIPSKRVLRSRGGALPVKALREVLSDTLLGDWALDSATIMLLWRMLLTQKPRIIIESGSGASTIILARYMQQYRPDGRIISLEENNEEKSRVEKKLQDLGLSAFPHIIYAPLDGDNHYQINHETMESILNRDRADWLIIDGPSGQAGCRSAVLDAMMPYLKSGAYWFIDDAFRDGELNFLQTWQQQSDHIKVMGIYPVGKGLATGTISQNSYSGII